MKRLLILSALGVTAVGCGDHYTILDPPRDNNQVQVAIWDEDGKSDQNQVNLACEKINMTALGNVQWLYTKDYDKGVGIVTCAPRSGGN